MRKHPDRELTATDLCRSTRMLKSQMNRTLNSMEEKHVITRERSKTDKRNVYVRLDLSKISIYHDQHRKVLEIVDSIIEKLGTETADEAIRIFNLIADTAMEVIE
jgi:DNA-binding MarR family transcriptional regulator